MNYTEFLQSKTKGLYPSAIAYPVRTCEVM